jgi:hypothetical protein
MSRLVRTSVLVFVLFASMGLAVSFASGAVATFTPTADASIGSLTSWPNGPGTTPLYWNNEGALYWTMCGQLGPFDANWGGVGMDTRCIQRYDVSALGGIPNLRIDSITLRLYSVGVDSFWNNAGATLHPEIHPITAANRNWEEGIGDPTHGGDGLVVDPGKNSWGAKVTGITNGVPYAIEPWAGSPGLTTSGVDYDNALKATRTLTKTQIQTTGTPVDFTFNGSSAQLTGLINSWLVDNYTLHRDNPGLLLFNPVADPYAPGLNQRFMFYSRHPWTTENSWPAPQPGWVPQLIVNYTQVPEPGTLALLVSGLIVLAACIRKSSFSKHRPGCNT